MSFNQQTKTDPSYLTQIIVAQVLVFSKNPLDEMIPSLQSLVYASCLWMKFFVSKLCVMLLVPVDNDPFLCVNSQSHTERKYTIFI